MKKIKKRKKYETKWSKIGVDKKSRRKLYDSSRLEAKERLVKTNKQQYNIILKMIMNRKYKEERKIK